MKNTIVRAVTALAGCAVLGVATPAPASASTAAVEFTIRVNPTDLSAAATVHDSLGGTFAATLTAAGAVTCGVVSPQTTITATDQGTGNPVNLYTPGTCRPYNGEVTYDLVWAGIVGTSGHHTVVCVAHLGAVTCSLDGIQFSA